MGCSTWTLDIVSMDLFLQQTPRLANGKFCPTMPDGTSPPHCIPIAARAEISVERNKRPEKQGTGGKIQEKSYTFVRIMGSTAYGRNRNIHGWDALSFFISHVMFLIICCKFQTKLLSHLTYCVSSYGYGQGLKTGKIQAFFNRAACSIPF